ncbi:epoxide hydrolase family protein [Mesorhizobium sp. UC22_110]|uniref:epoxide hydrolase family protein n=1 Tax=unclassified Mesorhizobium TaxID=325217 RepID=UPI003671CD8C
MSLASRAAPSDTTAIRPFKVAVPDMQIVDLKARLGRTRWPYATTNDHSRGQPVSFVMELVDQWMNDFDWREHEARLNSYPQFITEIDGQPIHFLHIGSRHPGAFPLILSHGWPGSVMEFLELIEPLTNPTDGGLPFDLVIPSLPGFGFSSPLREGGWDSARIAKAWDTLMKRLGYDHYGAHGGDVGSGIGRELGILQPRGLVGTHVLQIFAFPTGAEGEMDKLTPFEMEGMAILANFEKYNGYHQIQAKRPGTLAYGLVDSPVAQMAWNTELWFGFDGNNIANVDRDRFLAQASLYWFTGTGGSAANVYYEDQQTGAGYREVMNPTPTGVAVFPNDFRSVRSFAERANNIAHWTEMPRGSHFAASDAPDLLAHDIRAFFSKLNA